MITIDAGNVLLKPTQKKQMLARLKRALRLGDRIGNFMIKISLRRTGKHVEVTATGQDRLGQFAFRNRGKTWMDALHAIVRDVFRTVHSHAIGRVTPAIA